MTGFIRDGDLVVEMLLCESARSAFILQEPVSWCAKDDKEDYRCMAPDPSTFPPRRATGKGDVPMKFINENPEDHTVAAEWFVRALNARTVSGLPCYLLQASMPIEDFHQHLAQGDIMIFPEQQTVAFLKKMTRDFYPRLTLSGTDVDEQHGVAILEDIYEKKPHLRKRKWHEENEEPPDATCKRHKENVV